MIQPQLPEQLPLPFEQPFDEARLLLAAGHLVALDIKDPQLTQRILADPALVEQLFGFVYRLKTGKVKATTNPGGLFLTMAGLRKAK